MFDEGYNFVFLIFELEEVVEDLFDLMRYLRLNKFCYVIKGMFLEFVMEEFEVLLVGSGIVWMRILRRLFNEEGMIIVWEELLE